MKRGYLLEAGGPSIDASAPFALDPKIAGVMTEVEPGIYGKKLRLALFNHDPDIRHDPGVK